MRVNLPRKNNKKKIGVKAQVTNYGRSRDEVHGSPHTKVRKFTLALLKLKIKQRRKKKRPRAILGCLMLPAKNCMNCSASKMYLKRSNVNVTRISIVLHIVLKFYES